MSNFTLQYGASWLRKSGSSTCLLCKDGNVEDISHFLVACPKLEDEWATPWYILKERFQILITLKNILLHFIEKLDKPTTARLLIGAFPYPLIAVLRILLTSLLLYPFERGAGSDKTCSKECFHLDEKLM